MDRAIKNLLLISLTVFLILSAMIFKWSVADSLKLRAHPANKRSLLAENMQVRGTIFSAEGQILAKSSQEGEVILRKYPFNKLFSQTIGYASIRYGKSGLESTFDHLLSMPPESSFWSMKEKQKGKDIVTTLDVELQKSAASLLKTPGAVVAIEPKTGAIRCIYSYPVFNPEEINEKFDELLSNPEKPLINRATLGLYPPGSSFKIITLSSYLKNGFSLMDVYEAPGEFKVGGFRVTNFDRKDFGRLTVEDAFVYSVNTVFAQMGLKLGSEKFEKTVREFGLDKALDLEIPTKSGVLPGNLEDKVTLAWMAVGQAEMLVSPLQMALVSSIIANEGRLISPTLISGSKKKERQVLSPEVAKAIKEAMVLVTERGTGKRAKIPGMKVAGKTGTAEVETGESHSWFVGFVPADDPKIAISVIVEHGGVGGVAAASIFREIAQKAIQK